MIDSIESIFPLNVLYLSLMQTLVTETSNELLYERDAMTGNTVLHMATQKQPLIALLELKGSQLDVNAKNHAGQTPIHMYTHKDDLQLVFAIAAYDVDLDLLDNDGHTALSIAVSVRIISDSYFN